jgi:hypothetical protein
MKHYLPFQLAMNINTYKKVLYISFCCLKKNWPHDVWANPSTPSFPMVLWMCYFSWSLEIIFAYFWQKWYFNLSSIFVFRVNFLFFIKNLCFNIIITFLNWQSVVSVHIVLFLYQALKDYIVFFIFKKALLKYQQKGCYRY